MIEPFEFIKFTDVDEPVIRIGKSKFLSYFGVFQDNLASDVVDMLDKHIASSHNEIRSRIFDCIRTIEQMQLGPALWLDIDIIDGNGQPLSSYGWHRDYSFYDEWPSCVKIACTITGEKTAFLSTSEYNRNIIQKYKDQRIDPDLPEDIFSNESIISPESNELVVFNVDNGHPAIHSAPLDTRNRIFICSVVGPESGVRNLSRIWGEEDNYNILPSKQDNLLSL